MATRSDPRRFFRAAFWLGSLLSLVIVIGTARTSGSTTLAWVGLLAWAVLAGVAFVGTWWLYRDWRPVDAPTRDRPAGSMPLVLRVGAVAAPVALLASPLRDSVSVLTVGVAGLLCGAFAAISMFHPDETPDASSTGGQSN